MPMNPYSRLLQEFRELASGVQYRHRRTMWVYPKATLGEHWDLKGLYERVAAAEQIGYDVVLRALDDGLRVEYVKKPPERPYVTE